MFEFNRDTFTEFLAYLADVLGSPSRVAEEVKRNLVATMACKKAVKARDSLTPQEAVRIIDDLRKTRDGEHCPHGRPTMFYLSAAELARKFERSSPL